GGERRMVTGPVHPIPGSGRMNTLRAPLLEMSARDSFDRLIRLAIKIFDVPVAFVLVRDEDRFVVRSQAGFSELGEQAVDPTSWYRLWQSVLATGEPLMIADVRKNPFVEHGTAISQAGI